MKPVVRSFGLALLAIASASAAQAQERVIVSVNASYLTVSKLSQLSLLNFLK